MNLLQRIHGRPELPGQCGHALGLDDVDVARVNPVDLHRFACPASPAAIELQIRVGFNKRIGFRAIGTSQAVVRLAFPEQMDVEGFRDGRLIFLREQEVIPLDQG